MIYSSNSCVTETRQRHTYDKDESQHIHANDGYRILDIAVVWAVATRERTNPTIRHKTSHRIFTGWASD